MMNYSYAKQGWLAALMTLIFMTAMLSCGGGGGGGGGNPPPQPQQPTLNTISGVASKGLVSGGSVSVFAITASGAKGALLETGQTDGSGNYSVQVDHEGPVLVEVTGGQYVDEAAGGPPVALAGTLRAAIPALGETNSIAVTPLTELAARKAESGPAGFTQEKIAGANDLVSQLIDADILATQPTDCLDGAAFLAADAAARNYALMLAAISQMADTSGKYIFDIIDEIETDMEDGQMDATGADMQDGLSDFLAGPNNDTGSNTAEDLESSIADCAANGFQSAYAVSGGYLQYRSFEDATDNRFTCSFGIRKDGGPIDPSEIAGIELRNASGAVVDPRAPYGSSSEIYLRASCDAAQCTSPYIMDSSGMWGHYDVLSPGLYTLEVTFSNGQTASKAVTYAGQVEIPIVPSTSYQAQWVGNDLNLSWTNPTGSTNWDQVDKLRIMLYDIYGRTVAFVDVEPSFESVTLPASLLDQAAALGAGGLGAWRMRTQALDDTEIRMNYSRGYSDRANFPAKQSTTYEISFSFLQQRAFEDPVWNRYVGVFGLMRDGRPIGPEEVFDATVTDSTGAVVPRYLDGRFRVSHMRYNCAESPCTQDGPINEAGGWGYFLPLDPGTYSLQVNMPNGQTLLQDFDVPAQTVLPPVSSATMTSQWNQGDLELAWTNPTGAANWDVVDQLRIVVYDESGNDILYARANPTDESITLPGALLDQAVGLMGGRSAVQWQVQTRAHDAGEMNYARGYSDLVYLTGTPYRIESIRLMFRTYEDGRAFHSINFSLDHLGNAIAETQVLDGWIKNAYGVTVSPYNSGFSNSSSYFYDLASGTPRLSEAREFSGYWNHFNWLEPGNYFFQVEMDNHQVMSAKRLYPWMVALPFVSSTTMTSSSSGGDLTLTWTNPVDHPSWGMVEQLRLIFFNDVDMDVLYVRVPRVDETVTIPGALISQSALLGGGTDLIQWQIQTRSYFERVGVARGYSLKMDIN